MEGLFKHLGIALSLLRELKGLNQAQLAREAGLGKSQLSRYENGRELPKLDSLERILRVLGLGPSDFFHGLDLIEQLVAELTGPVDLEPVFRARGLLSEDTGRSFSRLFADLMDLYSKSLQDRLRPELEKLANRKKGVSGASRPRTR